MFIRTQYKLFSEIFRYPVHGYKAHVNDCMDYLLKLNYAKSAGEMRRFVDFVNSESSEQVEELFGKTFHIQAICYLDLGYVIFGEDYKRGEFLVHMKQEQAKAANDCGEELPDNLANVLALMVKTEDEEFLNELSVRILMPALRKMLMEFDATRLELKNKILKKKHKVLIQENINFGNIYFNVLKALLIVLEKDFQGVKYEDEELVPALGSNFLSNCGTCSVSEHTKTPAAK